MADSYGARIKALEQEVCTVGGIPRGRWGRFMPQQDAVVSDPIIVGAGSPWLIFNSNYVAAIDELIITSLLEL